MVGVDRGADPLELGELRVAGGDGVATGPGVLGEVEPAAGLDDGGVKDVQRVAETGDAGGDVQCQRPACAGKLR